MARAWRQQHVHIDGTGAAECLSDARTRVSGFHRVEDVLDPEAGRGECLRGKLDCERGGAALTLELQIDDALDLAEGRDHLVAGRIERVQVVAEHLDGDLRRLAAQALTDAIAKKGHYLTLCAGIVRENGAQRFLSG